jgi:hypothetical protein
MKMKIAAWLAALACGCASAQMKVEQSGEMCDPCLPPALKKAPIPKRAATDGAALRSEVEQRLRAPFDAAAREGLLTREQAAAAGLGFIVQNFAAIDRGGRGAIRFEDYRAFLKERGAALN